MPTEKHIVNSELSVVSYRRFWETNWLIAFRKKLMPDHNLYFILLKLINLIFLLPFLFCFYLLSQIDKSHICTYTKFHIFFFIHLCRSRSNCYSKIQYIVDSRETRSYFTSSFPSFHLRAKVKMHWEIQFDFRLYKIVRLRFHAIYRCILEFDGRSR